ncbi:hypothetical protein [Microbulbifer yueqingensis]|uniref:Uncharacterized protein n=1 Tax=Microbulbifer yueqingensis TaxID=658219 RepID=A0A1G9BMV7_9GAMM|nr:hypothetical protein [Microbulbifer yueqingensis]SDK40590.1 hypothetical protein SAMN05216212_2297 [Microbulbifer yueqingensis]
MPQWFEIGVVMVFAVAAVFFLAKYRETAAALHESERMKKRLSSDLSRYRDVATLRTLRDALVGNEPLPVDDDGREHLLLRDGDMQLYHLVLRRQCNAVSEGDRVTFRRDGEEVELEELSP